MGDDPRSTPPHAPAVPPERLWTPWRMRYVGGDSKEGGCIFCNRLAAADDVASLILWRAPRCFVIMNLFPYNTGHVMLVPNAHVPGPEDAESETLAEMATLRQPVLRALRRALSCDGFNLGINVGSFAGAGVAGHLHEHVVPRWAGDANFMPILAATMVLPELIPVTYAKLRAELEREMATMANLDLVVLDGSGQRVMLGDDGCLPKVAANDNEPVWRSATRAAADLTAAEPTLIGWAGDGRANTGKGVLAFQVAAVPNAPWSERPGLPADQARAVERARAILAAGGRR